MKNKKLFTILAILLLISCFFNLKFNPSENQNNAKLKNEYGLKNSKISEKFSIDGNQGWIDFRTEGNCSGSGLYGDPYVIEDLIIDGGGLGTGIIIKNSDVYFKIENTTTYNCDIGIEFENVSNGTLVKNNCSRNNDYAIYISGNHNNISNNLASVKRDACIRLNGTYNNISGNNMTDSSRGLWLWGSYNIVSNNLVENCTSGISIHDGYNNISNNNIVNIEQSNPIDIFSDYNIVSNNIIMNSIVGIGVSGSYNNISRNILYDNYLYGVDLREDGGYNLVYANNITESRQGIILNGNYHNISGNVIVNCGLRIGSWTLNSLTSHIIDSTNLVNGRPLYYYSNKTGLGVDNFTNAGQVVLINCNYSIISNMDISNTNNGISLYYCSENIISNNKLHNNIDYGFYSSNCHYNNYTNNSCFNNTYGLGIGGFWNNVSNNKINNNEKYGISCGGEYNILFNNSLNSNYYGIVIGGNSNTLKNNKMKACGIIVPYSIPQQFADITSHTIETTNLINGKPLYFYVNKTGLSAIDFANAGQILLINCNNSQIANLDLSNGSLGILLSNCFYSTLTNNNFSYNNNYGILLFKSNYTTIRGNFINNCENGIYIYDSNDNIISGNNVNYNQRLFGSIFKEGSGIYVALSHRNLVIDNNIKNNDYGLNFEWDCSNSTISGNIITNNSYNGLKMELGIQNEISRNVIMYNSKELIFGFSFNAFELRHSENCTIEENDISFNHYNGMYMQYCFNNSITKNTIENNGEIGLAIGIEEYGGSWDNLIYYNIFSNNGLNAEDNGVNNTWDNGSFGNYWDDYIGIDSDDDGVGDTPYYILGIAGSQDNYPLMEPPIFDKKTTPTISSYDIIVLICISFVTISMFFGKKVRKKNTDLNLKY